MMKNSKFNTNFSLWGIDIHIHSNSQQLFDMAVDYFHKSANSNKGITDKRIDFYFEKKKTLPNGRWVLDNWKKETYILESGAKDIRVRLNYQKGIIKSYLSSQCKFPRELIENLFIFRPLRLMLSKYGFFIIHAGCVAKNGRGILIPGAYGKGKTMTTLNLVRKGFKFLSDEHVLLKESNGRIKAHTFPQRIGIKKNLINLFPELKFLQNKKDRLHEKKRFWIDEAYPKAVVKICYPQLIIFPHFKKNGTLDLNRASRKETLLNILKDRDSLDINKRGLVRKDVAIRHFNILSSLIKQTDIYHLVYSDNNLGGLAKTLKKFKIIS